MHAARGLNYAKNTASTAREALTELGKKLWDKFDAKFTDAAGTAAGVGAAAAATEAIRRSKATAGDTKMQDAAPQPDQKTHVETVLPAELDLQMRELTEYSEAALTQPNVASTDLGRLTLVNSGDAKQSLHIREITDSFGATDRTHMLVRLVDHQRKQIKTIDLSKTLNRGWVDVYTDEAFGTAIAKIEKGEIITSKPGDKRRFAFDPQQDLQPVLQFIRTHRMEPKPPSPA